MAKATAVRQPGPIESVTLTLTPEEAYTIRSLVAHCAGKKEAYDIIGAFVGIFDEGDYGSIRVQYEDGCPVIRFDG